MGFLSDLFAPAIAQPYPTMPVVNTGLPQKAINDILRDKNVILSVSKIVLKKNEQCLFFDHAVRVDVKLRTVGNQRQRGGFTFRILSGWYYRTGNGTTMTVRDNVPEFQEGKLYITNQRIIFSSSAKSFVKKIDSLISYDIKDDYLLLQFERGNYCIYLPIISCVEKIMKKIV